jgi:hypothetical protein
MALHVLSGISMYYVLAKDLAEDKILNYLRFLVALLEEEHRYFYFYKWFTSSCSRFYCFLDQFNSRF